jgi:hypothetical protein
MIEGIHRRFPDLLAMFVTDGKLKLFGWIEAAHLFYSHCIYYNLTPFELLPSNIKITNLNINSNIIYMHYC